MTDQQFLEQVYVYLQTLPTADIWQDDKWMQDMEKMQVGCLMESLLVCMWLSDR